MEDSKCKRMVQKNRLKKMGTIFHVQYWRFPSADPRRINKQRIKICRIVDIFSKDREII